MKMNHTDCSSKALEATASDAAVPKTTTAIERTLAAIQSTHPNRGLRNGHLQRIGPSPLWQAPRLLAGAILAGVALLSSPATAQTTPANDAPSDLQTNDWRWLDEAQQARLSKSFNEVEKALKEAERLTNNAAVDAKLDSAKAGLKRIVLQEVPGVHTKALELLQQDRGEVEALRNKLNEPDLSAEWQEKYRALVSNWQAVIGSLELKIEEIKALEKDLGGFVKSFDEQRQYWRARVRLDQAQTLNAAIASWIRELQDLKGRLSTTLEPDKDTLRPKIGID
jgi:hypothetical protein